jgi:acetyl-CoA carboxylase biotin carboxyl carrier protein
MMLHDAIKKLIAILKEEDVDEIEVRRFWTTIRVARHRTGTAKKRMPVEEMPAVQYAGSAPAAEGGQEAPEAAVQADQPDAVEKSPPDTKAHEILSPMVGTFYRARSPQMEPFVAEGKTVEVGDVICIIEAMKLMNEIEADSKCVIRQVLVDDAQPVEYGQPLFLVESA